MSNENKLDEAFYFKLRDEMQQTRQRRFQFQLAKVTSLGTLVGAASLLIKNFELNIFFYVIPFIAFSFDLLIVSESFTLRRLSFFIFEEKKSAQGAEHRWELFVRNNPDRFASTAKFSFYDGCGRWLCGNFDFQYTIGPMVYQLSQYHMARITGWLTIWSSILRSKTKQARLDSSTETNR